MNHKSRTLKPNFVYGIKYKDCDCCLEYTNVDYDLKYKYLCCNKNYQKAFDENLKKRFANTCRFSNQDMKKFTLLPMNVWVIGKNLMIKL